MTTRPDVRLLTLGAPEVRLGGDAVPLPPKLLGLLAYLALGSPRRVARRDSLLALFWPDRDPGRARNALNQAVHQLRRRLRHELLESRGKGELILGSGLETDLERFEERLDAGKGREALELYRGHFLEGLHVRGAPGFERWLDGVRAGARRRMIRAALTLGSELASSDRLDEASGCLRRALALVPTDERLARRLMRVLMTAGDRTAALRLYHRFARRLSGELGVEPSEEMRALARDAGAVAETTRRALEVVSVPPLARRLAGRLADRADDLLDRGGAENAAARELLKQAIRLDPTHVPAHTSFARAIGHWVKFFADPFRELGRGLGAARWALELDGERPEAHFAHAFVLEVAGALDEAADANGTVLELRPEDSGVASRIGWVRCWAGDFAAALRWTDRARLGREEDPDLLHEKGMILHCLGEHDRGDELYGRSLQRRPHDRWTAATRVYFDLVTGDLKRGRRRAREMMAREPDGFAANVAGDAALASRDFS